MTTYKTKTISLSLDSIFRDDYYNTNSSDFTFNLPTPIKNVIKTNITSLEVPHFWYDYAEIDGTNKFIVTTNNYFITDKTNTSNPPIFIESETYQIVIPDGNYNNIDMVIFLTNYFRNIGGGLAYLIIEIDINSGKTIFRARDKTDSALLPSPYDPTTPYYSPDFYFTLDFRIEPYPDRPIYDNMGWSLGFNKPFYTVTYSNSFTSAFLNIANTSIVTYNGYLASESAFGSNYYNYIFLDLDDHNSNFSADDIISYLPGAPGGYLSGNNIIARAVITTPSNSINMTNGSDFISKSREYFGPVTISSLHVRLIDRLGDLIYLNNNDFSFLIEFTVLEQ